MAATLNYCIKAIYELPSRSNAGRSSGIEYTPDMVGFLVAASHALSA